MNRLQGFNDAKVVDLRKSYKKCLSCGQIKHVNKYGKRPYYSPTRQSVIIYSRSYCYSCLSEKQAKRRLVTGVGIPIAGSVLDKRIRLNPELVEAIIKDKGLMSDRSAATKHGVSRNTVRRFWHPEWYAIHREKYSYQNYRKHKRKEWASCSNEYTRVASKKLFDRKRLIYNLGLIKT